jgi:hypothetical protein
MNRKDNNGRESGGLIYILLNGGVLCPTVGLLHGAHAHSASEATGTLVL